MNRRRLFLLAGILISLFVGLAAFVAAGTTLAAPVQHVVEVPADLNAEAIRFQSQSGAFIVGSWLPGMVGKPGIVLMHGVRADRSALFKRARRLQQKGCHALLFDFQAHGESVGKNITFGVLESRDAHAAVEFMKRRIPGAKIGAIGISLGGAAALLGEKPISVDALILESVYPDISTAIKNRLHMRMGWVANLLTPLFLAQLNYRLGIDPKDLRPIDQISLVQSPILVMSGTDDLHTTESDTRKLFAAAQEPKKLEFFLRASHVDLEGFDEKKYWETVLGFFDQNL